MKTFFNVADLISQIDMDLRQRAARIEAALRTALAKRIAELEPPGEKKMISISVVPTPYGSQILLNIADWVQDAQRSHIKSAFASLMETLGAQPVGSGFSGLIPDPLTTIIDQNI